MSEVKFKAYNHISNGGITYELSDSGKILILGISVNQFGVITRFTTPVMEDSSRMLRHMADAIDKISSKGGKTQKHLINGRKFCITSKIIELDEKPELGEDISSTNI